MTGEVEPLVALTVVSQAVGGEPAEIGRADVPGWMVTTYGYYEATAYALESFAAKLREMEGGKEEPDGPTQDRS